MHYFEIMQICFKTDYNLKPSVVEVSYSKVFTLKGLCDCCSLMGFVLYIYKVEHNVDYVMRYV